MVLPVPLIAKLKDIKSQPNSRRSTDARSLLSLIDAEFILHLILFEDLFRSAKFMSDTLQSPDLLLETATDLTHSVITSIKEKRTESRVEQGRGPLRKCRCHHTTAAPTREEAISKASPSTGLYN